MSLACPRCSNPNVRRLSLIFQEGTSHIQTSTAGVATASGGGWGVGTAATTGRQQTLLSLGASPPTRMTMGGAVAATLFGVLLILGGISDPGGMLVVGLLFAGIGGYRVKRAMDYNRNVYPGLLDTWQNTFLCNRCGDRFVSRV